MIDDAWLADLLRHRASALADAGIATETAAALAAQGVVLDADGLVTRTLLDALDATWERGWQPADVAHVARRTATAGSVPLAVALIAEHARRTSAVDRAPETWVDQLRELGAAEAEPSGHGTVVTAWQRSERRSPAEAWRIALQLLGTLRGTARIELLVPPPSRWGAARVRTGRPAGGGDDRALRVIRGLLAKAESTAFAEEAEALTAKAQELMTRHAVDAAVLQGAAPPADVGTRRVHVADPYVRAKVQLLGAVAEANDVRLVWYQGLGIATVVGGRADLDAVELLFTSLLLQVAQGLAAAERHTGRHSSPRAFRRAFLLGYAHRIGERLQDARRRATAEAAAERELDLLPVLRSRREAVDAAVAELFPRLRTSRSRASVDAGGWIAGRSAAERADVGPRRSPLT
ncbi:hypothetical protein DQ239_13275 [Blastococcus sp. TF02-09]|uniref:DUF2786 domain-containing protein n=1 Tax=Blastococcus sp. TF02-09 TaxID=2250576 RepID=UPI000DEA4AB5|nr:DUF2786 domain-containing protein [Blastococcus sp. TF02-9]RBY76518.1 hypothetical protein DQ239_13275 [Blastococcus sp. TF02-9]